MSEERRDPSARECPSRELLGRIGDKWCVLVVGELADGRPHRFAQIRDGIEGISEKMLAQTLRRLEQDGLVSRKAFAEVPPRVEYRLTGLGHTLREPVRGLREWLVAHTDDVLEARRRHAS